MPHEEPPDSLRPTPPPAPREPDDHDDISQLVASVRAGDEDAWERLYRRYRPYLAILTSPRIPESLRQRFDTQDVVQSAFLSAHSKIGEMEFRDEPSFRAWLRKIAVNKLEDRIRGHTSARRGVGREAAHLDPDEIPEERLAARSIPSPSSLLLSAERSMQVLDELERLDDDQRDLVWKRVFEGHSWPEIASDLGCSESAARRRYAWALDALMRRLS